MPRLYILIFLIMAFVSCFGQRNDLHLRLDVGKNYKQFTDSKITLIQDLGGQTVNYVIGLKGSMSYFVDSDDESFYNMSVQYDWLTFDVETAQGTMHLNSREPDENNPFSVIFASMVGKTFQIKMSKKGKVLEVKNIESLFESTLNKFPEIPKERIEQIRNQLYQSYGAEAFKGNIEMVTGIFPKNAVSIGDHWLVETKLESGMSANLTSDYTLLSVTDNHYIISGDSKIQTANKDAYIESNGLPMKYDLTGTMTSEIKIDINSGWIVEAKMGQEIEGVAHVKESSQVPDGMKIPMTMKTVMVITDK